MLCPGVLDLHAKEIVPVPVKEWQLSHLPIMKSVSFARGADREMVDDLDRDRGVRE